MSMQDVFWAFVILGLLLTVSRLIRQNVRLLRRIFLPSSIIAGALAMLLGPQVLGRLTGDEGWLANGLWPEQMPAVWGALPGILINVVFAALLMGRPIPGLRKIWLTAGPQVCFGQAMAWGQYVVGIGLTMLVLTPLFDVPAIAGTLIEISFEGGHGTAAGMRQVFNDAGWSEGGDLALGLATVGLVGGVVIGTILINWAARRKHINLDETSAPIDEVELHSSDVTADEIRELRQDKERESQPTDPLSLHVGLVAVAISIGWLMLEGLKLLEASTWGYAAPGSDDEPVRVLAGVPLFPMAMLGGVVVQVIFDRLGRSHMISHRLMGRISGAALDFTIVAALGALSLEAIGANLGPFLLLAGAGGAWCVFCVFVIAPRIIPTGWFERGVGDFGQSMGVTVTGLLLMRVADPGNKSGALESFGYKQLLFEPIVGGGLFTGASVGLILAFGPGSILILTAVITVFWLVFGFFAFGRLARQNRAAERQNA